MRIVAISAESAETGDSGASASGKGQKIARCPTCRVAVWSNNPQAGPAVRGLSVSAPWINPDLCPPDIQHFHIFPSSRG